jgi:hypothetical protein
MFHCIELTPRAAPYNVTVTLSANSSYPFGKMGNYKFRGVGILTMEFGLVPFKVIKAITNTIHVKE